MNLRPDAIGDVAAFEKAVKTEFGKSFDPRASLAREPEVVKDWAAFDLRDKVVLDVGSGHPVVPALLTKHHPTLAFDCVDLSPDFEREAVGCIASLGGDPSRFRLVTGDFYDIADMAVDGRLRPRYDYVTLIESLHHSLRKAELLRVLARVMDARSRMILVEPVLPAIGREAAYADSQWARDLGYIEDPVGMGEYRAAFREAGLVVERIEVERSREFGLKSWKRRLAPDAVYRFYRRRVRPIYAQTTFTFVCRLAGGAAQ